MITTIQKSIDTEVYIANTIPQNIEAEIAVLGGILLDPNAIHIVIDILPPEAFFTKSHRTIYRACLKLSKQQETVDLMTVITYLRDKGKLEEVGGQIALINLLDRTVSSVQIDRYAKLILDKHRRRQILDLSHEMLKKVGEPIDTRELLEDLHERIAELNCAVGSRKTGNAEDYAYENLIKKFNEIEMNTLDPGKRSYRLGNLAKKAGMSRKELESLYYQHLIGKENEPVRYLSELRKECEDTSNEWYMQGFIPKKTVMLLHAAGGLGKSRISYDFAYHLASGKAWGQFHVTAPQRKVMLIQTDESKNDTMRAIADRWAEDRADQFICHKSKWSMAHIATLRHEIEAHGIEVVIIDSLTSVNKNSIFSENETEYARPILLLKEMAEELGCTFVIVHHSNKEGKSRGTQAIFNSVSLVLSLQLPNEGADRGSPNRLICIEKSRFHRPTKYKLRYEISEETHEWKWVCEGEDAKGVDLTLPTREKVLEFLHLNRNQLWSAIEINRGIGGSAGDVRKCCFYLANDGLIERKRSEGSSHAWLYFLPWDKGSFGDLSVDDRRTISETIGGETTDGNSVLLVGDRDRQILEKNFLKNETQKNCEVTIADQNEESQITIDTKIQGSEVADHLADRFGDPQRSLDDRSQETSNEQQKVVDPTLLKNQNEDPNGLQRDSKEQQKVVDPTLLKNQNEVADRYPFKVGDRIVNEMNGNKGTIIRIEGEKIFYYSEVLGELQTLDFLVRPEGWQPNTKRKPKPKGFGKTKEE